jgi:hypothetical protein
MFNLSNSYLIGVAYIFVAAFLLSFYLQQWINWIRILFDSRNNSVKTSAVFIAHMILALSGTLFILGLRLLF